MASQISWLVENRIIYWYSYDGYEQSSQIDKLDAEVIKLFSQSPEPMIHIVFNIQAVEGIPTLSDLMRAKLSFPRHPKQGWHILIGSQKPLQKMMVSVLNNTFKSRLHWVEDELEALEFLQSVDKNLPDLSNYKDFFNNHV